MRSHAKDGSLNETMILQSLNKHFYKELDGNWKRHMKRMFKNITDDDYIFANYYEFKDAKPDIEIIVKKRKILLSIKSGHAPAVHNEPIYTFFQFLRSFDVPERIINIIAFYHYGFSLKKNAPFHVYTHAELITKYSKYIQEVNDYFLNRKEVVREMIYRFVLRGRLERDIADYLYYGNSAKGFLLSPTDIMNLILNDENRECKSLCFCAFVYISTARNPKNKRRHQTKIYWPILCKYYYDKNFMERYG